MTIAKKIGTMFLALAFMATTFSACGNNTAGSTPTSAAPASSVAPDTGLTESDLLIDGKANINFAVLQGPTGIGAANLLEKNAGGAALNHYTPLVSAAPDEITAKLISGEADIAAVPTNLAAILHAKTKGEVKMLAINTLGVLHLVTADQTVASMADLKGKTIVASGQNAVPQYALEYLLAKSGLTLGADVTVEYKANHEEVAALLLAGGDEVIALLPEPFVTKVAMQNPAKKAVIDLTAVWQSVAPESVLTMGCIVARTSFIEQNPEVITNFLLEYEESIKVANEDPVSTAQFCERQNIIAADVAELAIPKCNLVFRSGQAMVTETQGFFQVLFAANPASVGGVMPDETLYYQG